MNIIIRSLVGLQGGVTHCGDEFGNAALSLSRLIVLGNKQAAAKLVAYYDFIVTRFGIAPMVIYTQPCIVGCLLPSCGSRSVAYI